MLKIRQVRIFSQLIVSHQLILILCQSHIRGLPSRLIQNFKLTRVQFKWLQLFLSWWFERVVSTFYKFSTLLNFIKMLCLTETEMSLKMDLLRNAHFVPWVGLTSVFKLIDILAGPVLIASICTTCLAFLSLSLQFDYGVIYFLDNFFDILSGTVFSNQFV